MANAPGKAYRKGITLIGLMEMFPSEKAATQWFEQVIWDGSRYCPKCKSTKTSATRTGKPMPYFCNGCRSYFSVRTGTPLAHSNVPLRKWAIAIYLCLTSLKSISSMKLHRDIGVSQPTAWFMLHRIREAWAQEDSGNFGGPVETDETYFGGRRTNMSNRKRKALENTGRGAVGKTAVVGIRDRESNEVRAKVVGKTDAPTLQGFIHENTEPGSQVFTDDATVYSNLPFPHEAVKHSVREYVRDMAHTNGVESFWATLKRAHKGTFHRLSPKHLNRYVQEFAGRHNLRDSDTLDQMRDTVVRLVGRRLLLRDLIADNGLTPASR